MRTRTPGVLWKSGLVALLVVLPSAFLTRGYWLPSIARGLVCAPTFASGDALLVENFNPSYLVFESAARLQGPGSSTRILVPVPASASDSSVPNPVSKGIAELMARFARLDNVEIVPVRQREPYALNTAYQVRDFLARERLRSMVVVAPAFRSRRSLLVYGAVLNPVGIQVACVPVFEGHTPEDWATSWHGIEAVSEQFVKLQFYRFYVLRRGVEAGPSRRALGDVPVEHPAGEDAEGVGHAGKASLRHPHPPRVGGPGG